MSNRETGHYTTWTATSKGGGTYAVEIDEDDVVIRAAGPLHHSDPRDAESLAAWIGNNFFAAVDGAWIEARRHEGHFGSWYEKGT